MRDSNSFAVKTQSTAVGKRIKEKKLSVIFEKEEVMNQKIQGSASLTSASTSAERF